MPISTGLKVSGTKGDHDYQEYKYDSSGHLIEKTLRGTKYVMKNDSLGREIESSQYKQDKLWFIMHSAYETNERGDWVKRHETLWMAKYTEKGFVPWMECYREIKYWGEGGR